MHGLKLQLKVQFPVMRDTRKRISDLKCTIRRIFEVHCTDEKVGDLPLVPARSVDFVANHFFNNYIILIEMLLMIQIAGFATRDCCDKL